MKFKSQFKWGFAKVVVSRAGRLQEWSQVELRLYEVCIHVYKWRVLPNFVRSVNNFFSLYLFSY